MTEAQFEAEKNYQAAREIAANFHRRRLLTEKEFVEIDTILLQKYRPSLGTLFSESTCNSSPFE